MNVGQLAMFESWSSAAAPPPALTVSEWAEAKRVLSTRSGMKGARWRNDVTPYLKGIMDSVHEPGVKKIALRKCAQVGGSEAINNIVGYFIEHDPCPMLLVQPTISVAEEWSKERLSDMINSTQALADVVYAGKGAAARGESTLSLKMFAGGFLALGGANTPNTFARRSVRLAIGDDVDRFPAVVGEEGDPSDLLVKRTTTFHDGLVIMVSTPTLKGGRIDTLYERSDRRRYFVTCPQCAREDWIAWTDAAHFHVVYQDKDPDSARLSCPTEEFGGCGYLHDEATRRSMVGGGEWRPTADSEEQGLIGFHLPAMVTTLGSASLSVWVSDWLSARQLGNESTRVFINTTLGEGWEERGTRMNPHGLTTRREDYGPGVEVPAAAVAMTAGVDVQENRFELHVEAWGFAFERWVVDHRVIPGDPRQPETRSALLDALGRKYVHASGHQLPIHATCIDSGYATEEVYDFVLAHQARRIFATKGFAGKAGEPIVGKPSERRYGRSPRPVRLYPINVDDAKGDIINSLLLTTPGPGYMHFPLSLDTIDDEFFSQLCAEHRETVRNKAKVATHTVWVQDRERNEAFDLAVLCLAAFKLLNPNIRQMLEALKQPAAAPPRLHADSPVQVSSQPRPVRRVGRSDYLSS